MDDEMTEEAKRQFDAASRPAKDTDAFVTLTPGVMERMELQRAVDDIFVQAEDRFLTLMKQHHQDPEHAAWLTEVRHAVSDKITALRIFIWD